MPQSLNQIGLRIVFSTKERRPFLQDDSFRDVMFRMVAHLVGESGCVSGSVGGHVDHVHLLVGLSRTISVAKLVEQVKKESSKWAKRHKDCTSHFTWQVGYGVFSVSHSKRGDIDTYIRNQASHHEKLSFQDEYRRMCDRHDLEIDERYAWD